jgi:hypothetical protein
MRYLERFDGEMQQSLEDFAVSATHPRGRLPLLYSLGDV